MPKQSEEAKLRRRAVMNRRGVFATWGYPSWDALLVRDKTLGDSADWFAQHKSVGAVTRDVTLAVLSGEWQPPIGKWALLVTPKSTNWCHVVSQMWGHDLLKLLGKPAPREVLQTGYQDTAGVIYVQYTLDDVDRLYFETDGTQWEADAEPDDEFITNLRGDLFGADWLATVTSASDAHQKLVRHFDAYVPGMVWDGERLGAVAGHEGFLNTDEIVRIDLIRLGKVDPEEPSPDTIAASRALAVAAERGDLAGVRDALARGATIGKLPDSNCNALWLACYRYQGKPEQDAIIDTLLAASCDPNDQPSSSGTALEYLAASRSALADGAAAIIRKLAAAGADLNPKSLGTLMKDERPLHRAAKRARPDLVRVLLDVGADPTARDANGHTSREAVAHLLQGKSRYLTPAEMETEQADYAEVISLLAAADTV